LSSTPHQLETLLGYQLRRASSVLMSDLAERLAELGLRTTEASILVVLEAEPLITQSEIGRRLAIQRANMAPLIAGLTARDLIERTAGPGPARPLKLSKKGLALAAERAGGWTNMTRPISAPSPPRIGLGCAQSWSHSGAAGKS